MAVKWRGEKALGEEDDKAAVDLRGEVNGDDRWVDDISLEGLGSEFASELPWVSIKS